VPASSIVKYTVKHKTTLSSKYWLVVGSREVGLQYGLEKRRKYLSHSGFFVQSHFACCGIDNSSRNQPSVLTVFFTKMKNVCWPEW